MGIRLSGMDFSKFSDADLISLAQQQQALIAELQLSVAAYTTSIQWLERRLRDIEGRDGPTRGMPGHTPAQASPLERLSRRRCSKHQA